MQGPAKAMPSLPATEKARVGRSHAITVAAEGNILKPEVLGAVRGRGDVSRLAHPPSAAIPSRHLGGGAGTRRIAKGRPSRRLLLL